MFSVVNAESKNILVKVEETSNVLNYTSTVEEGSTSLIVDGKTISVNANDNSNNKDIKFIKTTGEANNWISELNGEGNYYFVSMFDNESLINKKDKRK